MKDAFKNISIQSALALSAAAALIYEVVATNVLFFYFIKSSYSIATILSVFLFGLGAGSLIVYKTLPKIASKKLLFAVFQIVIAVYAFFVLANVISVTARISAWGIFAASFAILLLPTIFLGAAFPLATSIFNRQKNEIVGLAYSSDLFGAIIGALLAGFIFIPRWGNKAAVLFAVGFNLFSALIILPKRFKIIPTVFLISLVAVSFWFMNFVSKAAALNNPSKEASLKSNSGPAEEYRFYKDTAYGTVIVFNDWLHINNEVQCRFLKNENITERAMADYALAPLKKETLSVLNIGLGCGGTLSEILKHPNAKADVVEINPAVVEANRKFSDVLKNPGANLIIDDGLRYLRNTGTTYDSILVDIENPTVAHSSNLYTQEAFMIIADRISSQGTFALWNYENFISDPRRYLDILFYTMKEAFPFVYQYEKVFLAAKQKLDQAEYQPTAPYEINTLDKNTLTPAYLEGIKEPVK